MSWWIQEGVVLAFPTFPTFPTMSDSFDEFVYYEQEYVHEPLNEERAYYTCGDEDDYDEYEYDYDSE